MVCQVPARNQLVPCHNKRFCIALVSESKIHANMHAHRAMGLDEDRICL